MRLIKTLALITVVVFTVSFAADDKCGLKFEGIYVFKVDAESSAVLRFYDDGTVIASTSINNYKKVVTWFNKENVDMVLSGKYKVKKCVVKFKVKGMTGEQEYKGKISGQTIDFELKDAKSKATVQRTYVHTKP